MAEEKVVDATQFAKLLHQAVSKAKKKGKKNKKDVDEKEENVAHVEGEDECHTEDEDVTDDEEEFEDESTDYHKEKFLEVLYELAESHNKLCGLFELLLDKEF